MSAAVLPPPSQVESLPRKKFTREEVDRMLDSGIFYGQRFELIDGDLIDKMGQNPPHASAYQLVLEWLAGVFGLGRVRGQLPMDAAGSDRERNVPEPDLAVLAEKKQDFDLRHPRGNELLLVVEVADTSLVGDFTFKRDLYARAGVPEYWVLDIPGRRVVLHRNPSEGAYADITVRAEYESIAPESHPEMAIPIAQILPRNCGL